MKNPASKKKFARYDNSSTVYFLNPEDPAWYVVTASSSESGYIGSIPAGCCISLLPLGHFVWHCASQLNDSSTFYIAVLSIISFSSVLRLNMNISLFWRTQSWASCLDSAWRVSHLWWPGAWELWEVILGIV